MNDHKEGGLNINRDKINKEPRKMTQEDAAKVMAQFYDTMHSSMINLVAIFAKISEELGDISTDTNDMAFYMKKTALQTEAVTQMEVEEQEKEDDPEEPPNYESAETPK